jgi:hypothetical protein
MKCRFFVEHGAFQAGAEKGEAMSCRLLIATGRLGKLEEVRATPID